MAGLNILLVQEVINLLVHQNLRGFCKRHALAIFNFLTVCLKMMLLQQN